MFTKDNLPMTICIGILIVASLGVLYLQIEATNQLLNH